MEERERRERGGGVGVVMAAGFGLSAVVTLALVGIFVVLQLLGSVPEPVEQIVEVIEVSYFLPGRVLGLEATLPDNLIGLVVGLGVLWFTWGLIFSLVILAGYVLYLDVERKRRKRESK